MAPYSSFRYEIVFLNIFAYLSKFKVGVAYLAVSGFDLNGEPGINSLNFVFSYFDQVLILIKSEK